VHAVLLLPFVLLRVDWRRWWIVPGAIALLYLPFWLQGSFADLAGLRAFFSEWEFNSTVFALLAAALGTSPAKAIGALVFAFVYGTILQSYRKTPTQGARGDVVYGIFFLLSAVVNPWYMLWLLPFVALRPTVAGLTACAVISLSYVHGLNLEATGLAPFEHPWWVRPVEVGVVAFALGVDLWLRLASKRKTR
jgi:hypothetical protein